MDIKKTTNFYENNFNLIRLFAALQVAHFHLIAIYGPDTGIIYKYFVKFLGFFPGVPIFFFISGFLISKSWETSTSWKSYAIKRLARIEPALIASVIFAIALTFISGYFQQSFHSVSALNIIELFFAKSTILQSFNPDYLRAYGDGVLNGSLWTITVEIQFYLLIPLIYLLLRRLNSSTYLIILTLVFVVANQYYDYLHHETPNEFITKLIKISFLPWLFMFLAGILAQRNFKILDKYVSGKLHIYFPVYILASLIGLQLNLDFGNSFNPVLFALLAFVILSAAYSYTSLTSKLLGESDISYGLYLYHMPWINFFLYKHITANIYSCLLLMVLIAITSHLSWKFLESPSLKLGKRLSLKYR